MYPQFARVLSLLSLFCLGLSLVLAQEGSGSLPAGGNQEDYQLSIIFDDTMISGSEDILQTPYSDTFSCEGQGYGYYADVQSGCQVIKWKTKNQCLFYIYFLSLGFPHLPAY